MKKYVDPEMNVVLFDDRTFVNNGVGTSETGAIVIGPGDSQGESIPIVTNPDPDEEW